MLTRAAKYRLARRALNIASAFGRPRTGTDEGFRSWLEQGGRVGLLLQWGIGDAVLAIPLLRALRRRYPHCTIELLGKGWLGELFADTPFCDRVHRLVPPWTKYGQKYRIWRPEWQTYVRQLRTLRTVPFDLLLSIRDDAREVLQLKVLTASAKAGYSGSGGRLWLDIDFGMPPHLAAGSHVSRDAAHAAQVLTGLADYTPPVLPVSHSHSKLAAARLRSMGYREGLMVAISLQAGHPIRRWDAHKMSLVLRDLPSNVGFVVLIADPEEGVPRVELPSGVPSAVWRSSLGELKGLLSVVDVLLCTESGVMHIGAACGCRVVAIFGPMLPAWFGPVGNDHEVAIVEPLSCRPCFDRCIHQRPVCMTALGPDAVSAALARTVRRLEARACQAVPVAAGSDACQDRALSRQA